MQTKRQWKTVGSVCLAVGAAGLHTDRDTQSPCTDGGFFLACSTEKDIKVATNKQIGICCYKSILISYLSSMSI